MPTLEEIDAAIARKQQAVQQPNNQPTLEQIDAAIAQKTQQQAPEQPKLSYFDRAKARHDKVVPMIKEAMAGDAEFKGEGVTNYEDWSSGQKNFGYNLPDIKTTFAGMFGTDEDKSKSFFKNHPQYEKQTDKNGNDYFVDNGTKVYIDDPKLDLGDVGDFIGQAGSYAVGGGLAAPVKNVLARTAVNNPLTRSAVTSGSMYGTDVANQLMAGRDEIDQGQAGTAAALGGAVELASPYVGKVFKWAKDRLSGSAPLIKKGAKIAKAKNLNLPDDELETLGRIRNTLDKSVPDDAIIAEYQHGLKLTKGQATGNLKQLSKEQQLREQPDLMNRFRQVDDFNQNKVEQNLREIRGKMGGQVDDVLEPAVTAETAQGALNQAEQTAKKAYQDAYSDVGNLFVKKQAAQGLGDRLKKAVTSKDQWLDEDTPKALKAVNDIVKKAESMGNNVAGFSLKAFDSQRKKINNLFSRGMDETDKRALTIVKNELDDWFYNSIDDSLLKGDSKALTQLTKARGLMHDYSKRFNAKDKVNKVISKIVREETTPEEFSQMLVGVNGVSKAGAGNLVKAYKGAVGDNSEGFNALKSHVFEKIILSNAMKPDGSTALKGYQGIRSAFNQAFKTKGKTMMKELFTQDEANQINSLMRSVGKLVVDEDLINASGSGRFGARLLAEYGNKIPILGKLFQTGKNTIGYAGSQSKPLQQLDMPIPEILGVTQAVNQ
jgi:hypothetical protein